MFFRLSRNHQSQLPSLHRAEQQVSPILTIETQTVHLRECSPARFSPRSRLHRRLLRVQVHRPAQRQQGV